MPGAPPVASGRHRPEEGSARAPRPGPALTAPEALERGEAQEGWIRARASRVDAGSIRLVARGRTFEVPASPEALGALAALGGERIRVVALLRAEERIRQHEGGYREAGDRERVLVCAGVEAAPEPVVPWADGGELQWWLAWAWRVGAVVGFLGRHAGAQGDRWKNKPSMIACGSCHDMISFVEPPPPGKTLHAGGPFADDSKCSVCHPPAGGLEGIATKHAIPHLDPANPQLTMTIVRVENSGLGQTPEIVFQVAQNGLPLDILATPLTRLNVTIAGPTSDYATYWQHTIQGTGATGTLTADGANFRYTFPAAMPTGAAGTYAFGLEGYVQPGGSTGPRFAAPNPVTFSAVTDPMPEPRRTIVSQAQCNHCHLQLSAHGGQRIEVQYCAFCHQPNNVNDDRVARFEGKTVEAQSVDLAVMVHRIHMGNALTEPYVLGGNPTPTRTNPAGTPIDFGEVRYPGDRNACWTCHTGPSYQLPLPSDLLPKKTQTLTCTEDPTADADAYCDSRIVQSEKTIPPETAACTGCHDAPYVVAHAETMTSASGIEACATCHGPGAEFDVQKIHAPQP